jgi:membrane-associated phospholipid phosphatase
MDPQRQLFTLRRYIFQSSVLALVMVTALGGYLAVLNWRGKDGGQRITWTPWDEYFPFMPGWVWVYLIPYILGPAVVGLLTARTFWWYVQRGLATVFVTLLIFILLPTQTAPRPPHNLSGPTGQLYQWMVEIDEPPANAAPSLHVSLTFLLGLAILKDFPRWWPVTVTAVLLVWLATLFTRQHHLLDVVTGAGLALVVTLVWPPSRLRLSEQANTEVEN